MASITFAKSLLLSRQTLLAASRVSFSRRVVAPRILRVQGDDGPDYAKPQPVKEAHPKYHESFITQESLDEFQNSLPKVVKNKDKKSNTNGDIPRYEKACDKKNEFRAMMSNLAVKKRREERNLMVIEGKRIINEAIDANLSLKFIYFSLEENLESIKNLNALLSQGTRLMKVLYKDMKIFSPLITPPGIMAVSERPNYENLVAQWNSPHLLPVTLICDNVRDPGNLGTILRTSAAAGVGKVILTSGCVDAWNDKVIKSAAGAHFYIPILNNVPWSEIATHLPAQPDIYIADSNLADGRSDAVKSANYFNLNFFDHSKSLDKVLIIANEAFGPSSDSFALARQFGGCRVQIPLYKSLESLNSAIASSILLFEMKKQFDKE